MLVNTNVGAMQITLYACLHERHLHVISVNCLLNAFYHMLLINNKFYASLPDFWLFILC